MKQNEDINDLLARHFSNESLTAGQRQELEAWIRHNRSEYERLKKFTDRIAVLPEQVHFDANQAWEKIEPRLTANLIPFKRKKHFLTYASVAASLLILLSVATVSSGQIRTHCCMQTIPRPPDTSFCRTVRKLSFILKPK